MRTKEIVGSIILLLTLLVSLSSCSADDENFEALNEEKVSQTVALNATEQFRNDMKQAFANSQNGNKVSLSDKQTAALQTSATNMLKAEGMYTEDVQELEAKDQASVILMGAMYLALSSQKQQASKFLKTRSSETTDCYSIEKFENCAISALKSYLCAEIIKSIIKGELTSSCLTHFAMKKIAKKLAVKAVGGSVGAAIEISYNILRCMGVV